jgi:uncharacterized protein (TIGR03067 family)
MRGHVVAAILLVPGLAVAASPRKDASQIELKSLQGIWIAVAGEEGGQKAPDSVLKNFKLVVEGNKLSFSPEIDKPEWTFELDTAKRPRQIIMTPVGAQDKDKVRAIYSVEKDVFKLCVKQAGTSRGERPPADFSTRTGDGQRLLVLGRQKPFRCSLKRPFPFDSQSILKLPENEFVDSWHVIFQGSPNFFEVSVGFVHKGPADPQRIIVAQIHLLDQHGQTIAWQTYKCPDARANFGQQVAPGIRSGLPQSVDFSHWEKDIKDRVAEVEFVFDKLQPVAAR